MRTVQREDHGGKCSRPQRLEHRIAVGEDHDRLRKERTTRSPPRVRAALDLIETTETRLVELVAKHVEEVHRRDASCASQGVQRSGTSFPRNTAAHEVLFTLLLRLIRGVAWSRYHSCLLPAPVDQRGRPLGD
jgi:hypothetical protein